MTVADVIEDARYGELAQLGVIKRLDTVSTKEAAERQILTYINLGLIELYKRFNMRTEQTVVTMQEDVLLYTLTTANIYDESTNPNGYLDTILSVFNSVVGIYDEAGDKVTLNAESDIMSVNTPSYNVLQIPNPSTDGVLFVLYSAAPDKLMWNADLSSVDVLIPPVMLEALLYYMGYRAHASNKGSIDAENNTHYMRFNASCANLKKLGLVNEDPLVGVNVQNKGYI